MRAEKGLRMMAVNADEGEPGTFKDRYYLEKDPHRFIEGMLIAAFVVEAVETYIYIRDEYPELRLMLAEELAKVESGRPRQAHQAASAPRRRRLHLRRNFGDDRIDRGQARSAAPPAAVCRAGRPVRTADARTERRDALLDPRHRREGPGVGHRPRAAASARVFAASRSPAGSRGPVSCWRRRASRRASWSKNIAAAWPTARCSRAICPGGASGGILPASMADLPLDFGTLEKYGCFVGSHAVVILSERDDMKAVALNLLKFFEDESCGQCTPLPRRHRKGRGADGAGAVGRGAADRALRVSCATPRFAGSARPRPIPLLCVLKYFPDELKTPLGRW